MTRTLLLTALLAILPSSALASDDTLTTLSERSGFVRTGRYDEVIALCEAFARRYPDAVRCADFGTTPLGLRARYCALLCCLAWVSTSRSSCGAPNSISNQWTTRLAAPGA